MFRATYRGVLESSMFYDPRTRIGPMMSPVPKFGIQAAVARKILSCIQIKSLIFCIKIPWKFHGEIKDVEINIAFLI